MQLDDWEYVTSMRHLYLSSEGMHAGQRAFLVLGTNFNYGEDITSRGHIKVNICLAVIILFTVEMIEFCHLKKTS